MIKEKKFKKEILLLEKPSLPKFPWGHIPSPCLTSCHFSLFVLAQASEDVWGPCSLSLTTQGSGPLFLPLAGLGLLFCNPNMVIMNMCGIEDFGLKGAETHSRENISRWEGFFSVLEGLQNARLL